MNNPNFSRTAKASELANKYWMLATNFDDPLSSFYLEVYHHWMGVYMRSMRQWDLENSR